MDSEEIKLTRSMRDVVALYGLHPNRSGFICCPFHKERTPSMKIYKDSFYCFGCGKSGDVFRFVEQMDDVSFKEAFLQLGGDYPEHDKKSDMAVKMRRYHFEKQREMEKKKRLEQERKRRHNNARIGLYLDAMRASEPLSDAWCEAYNNYQIQVYEQCHLNGLEERW